MTIQKNLSDAYDTLVASTDPLVSAYDTLVSSPLAGDAAALIDGFDAATNSTIVPPTALGVASSPSFLGDDAITVPAGGFTAIYSFGDSLSDAGNDYRASGGLVPVAPYSDGRFTDGNLWVQDLASTLGLPIPKASLAGGTDYAYGDAQTGTTADHTATPIDLPSQLAQFIANVPAPSPNALYTVWAGSNDILGIAGSTETAVQQQTSVTQAVTNETDVIDGMIAHGAKDLVVLDVPDLGKTPEEAAIPATAAKATTLAEDFNAGLGEALQKIVASGDAKIDYVDTFGLLDSAIANPSAYDLTNVTQPLWTGDFTSSTSGHLAATGSAAAGYLFFDGLHPTATGHALIADGVSKTLTGIA